MRALVGSELVRVPDLAPELFGGLAGADVYRRVLRLERFHALVDHGLHVQRQHVRGRGAAGGGRLRGGGAGWREGLGLLRGPLGVLGAQGRLHLGLAALAGLHGARRLASVLQCRTGVAEGVQRSASAWWRFEQQPGSGSGGVCGAQPLANQRR